jgi:hypothetical protein
MVKRLALAWVTLAPFVGSWAFVHGYQWAGRVRGDEGLACILAVSLGSVLFVCSVIWALERSVDREGP